MVAATLAVGYWLLLPSELEELGRSSVAQALLFANVYFWTETGYFAGPAELKPLLHTWSLAVEEQFYLFFPFFMVFCKKLNQKRLFWMLIVIASISLIGSTIGVKYAPTFTFFLLPTRAWELLIGCMLAVFPWQCKSSPRRDSGIAMLGCVAIVLPVFLYDSKTPFPGIAAAPPVLGTAAIIFATATTPSIWLCKVLSLRPFVFIGLISYSLYLWHWPVIVYTRMGFGRFDWIPIAFALVVSFLLAILSWKFIETPCRQNTFVKQRRKLFASAIALSGVTIAVGLLFIGMRGLPQRFSNYPYVLAEDAEWNGNESSLQTWFRFNPISPAELPTLGRQSSKSQGIDFFIWGDSHGMALSNCFDEIANELNLTGKAALMHGSPPLPGVASAHQTERLKLKREILRSIEELKPANLILVAYWQGYNNIFSANDSSVDPKLEQKHFQELITFCSKNSISLWIVKQVPKTQEPAAAAEILKFALGRTNYVSNERKSLADHKTSSEDIELVFRELNRDVVRFVDPSRLLFDSNQETINYSSGRALYRDQHHLSRWGAERIKPIIEEMLREVALQLPKKLILPRSQ